ncbi:MAG: reverse transcriptase family protein [Candidatus Thiodiazotropha taylori]|nr:reverse transcriptase family protein [Candidatus Thiodiazotropha taylori]
MQTSDLAIEELTPSADVILIQEHWLFDCKLHTLNELSQIYNGAGKAVDSGDPILPVQMPRGYGGVGVLWKKDIDHLIQVKPDGGNRIQCIELKGQTPLLVISVYMPCKGLTDNVEDFNDCLDQLNEIIQKYSSTHIVVIGGDWNEDLYSNTKTGRQQSLKDFIRENDLTTKQTQKTYINPRGAETSTLDYILYPKTFSDCIGEIRVLDNLKANVSDHLPVGCTIRYEMDKAQLSQKTREIPVKMKWEKLDKDLYINTIKNSLECIETNYSTLAAIDTATRKINNILEEAATLAAPKGKRLKRRTSKLKVWTPEIQEAVNAKKKAFHTWKQAGRPDSTTDQTLLQKKYTTSALRQAIRFEYSKKQTQIRQEILDSRTSDSKLFYKLINRQRGKLSNCINELHVGNDIFQTENEILNGWHQHFKRLATPQHCSNFDSEYQKLVQLEFNQIADICEQERDFTPITPEEVTTAIKSLNTGKSGDIFNIKAEHFVHAVNMVEPVLVTLFNAMMKIGLVPDCMKLGVLTPVFKRKGSNLDAKNYRGITITPTIAKILESVLRERIKPIIMENQNILQRGFTEGSSPMNCSLILEEYIRNNKDSRKPTYVAFLDAKSAFDVVNHSSLLRKVYHLGIEGAHWNLINSLHRDARSVVKWDGCLSEQFEIQQGVRQGGVLSTDLYKIYANPLLDRLEKIDNGAKIGDIGCAAPACADDVAVASSKPEPLQSLINTSADYGSMEHYEFQLAKSVILKIDAAEEDQDYVWTLNGEPMPVVTESMHVGILRSASTQTTAVAENIKKARRTLYSLMPSGCHGHNGLDPETTIHLLQTYVLPTLIYGMEVVLPQGKHLDTLEKFYKKYLKLLLSLPITTADPAVYVLSGTVPIEATIHKRALILFGSISRLSTTAIEKQIAYRQLNIKGHKSNSWFVMLKELCFKYDLPHPLAILDNPYGKEAWRRTVNKHVHDHWVNRIRHNTPLYSSLKYLHAGEYYYGRRHPVVRTIGNARENPRICTKLKLVTGTYILQSNRAMFNQNRIDSTCLMCKEGDETVEYFLLNCTALSSLRQPIIDIITDTCASLLSQPTNNQDGLLQLILDSSAYSKSTPKRDSHLLEKIEFHSRRLCHTLHCERHLSHKYLEREIKRYSNLLRLSKPQHSRYTDSYPVFSPEQNF